MGSMNNVRILDNAFVSGSINLYGVVVIKGNASLYGIGVIFRSVIEGDVDLELYLLKLYDIHWWRNIP